MPRDRLQQASDALADLPPDGDLLGDVAILLGDEWGDPLTELLWDVADGAVELDRVPWKVTTAIQADTVLSERLEALYWAVPGLLVHQGVLWGFTELGFRLAVRCV